MEPVLSVSSFIPSSWCSLLIVWASFIEIYCTLTLRTPIWDNNISLWVTKFTIHCKIKGPHSRTMKATEWSEWSCSVTSDSLRPQRWRSGGCAGSGGPRGATPHSRSEGAAVRRYPSSKVRETQVRLELLPCSQSMSKYLIPTKCHTLSGVLPHIRGKRNPSKTAGVARGHQRAEH